jgi:hypothetical protein
VRTRQGGQQSGAAGEMPPTKLVFADRLDNEGGQKPTDNQPAEVAMGRKDSYTARPDGTAARHTDARSLAVPAPRGTMIPTAAPTGTSPTVAASPKRTAAVARSRLRRTIARVYAAGDRVRVFFRRRTPTARPVPNAGGIPRCSWGGQKSDSAAESPGRDHGRDDRRTWENMADRGRRVGNFYRTGRGRDGGDGYGTNRLVSHPGVGRGDRPSSKVRCRR